MNTLLSKEEYAALSREKATIVRGVVFIPAARMGEFVGFEYYKTEYFSPEKLNECLVYPDDYRQEQ